jgi:hypothetical protein
MNYFSELSARLASLVRWQQAFVATTCVEHVWPLIQRLGRTETRKTCGEYIETLWALLLDLNAVPSVAKLIMNVGELPEANCDDSNKPDYYVMKSISVLAYALETLVSTTPLSLTESACSAAAEIFGDCDIVLLMNDCQCRRIDPARPPAPGPLLASEIKSQFECIQQVREAEKPSRQLITKLRNDARNASQGLAHALPVFIQKQGWNQEG